MWLKLDYLLCMVGAAVVGAAVVGAAVVGAAVAGLSGSKNENKLTYSVYGYS